MMKFSADPDFRRSRWLPHRHLETALPHTAHRSIPLAYQREIAETPDSDIIAMDCILGDAGRDAVILFHGLEGDSQSRSVRAFAEHFASLGWSVAAPNFRTCGGMMNRLPRAYHAADDAEIAWLARYAKSVFVHARHLFAVGVSLGGAALMKRLIEHPDQTEIRAAATLCSPFDLMRCGREIDRRMNLNRAIYAAHFLRTLKAKVREKARRFPFIADLRRLKKARTLREFDSVYTAPMHGFADVDDYWRCASVRWDLQKIKTPLLCINALNDPLIPPDSLPTADESPPSVCFLRTKHGGHAGFVGAPKNWLPLRVAQFFSEAQ